MSLAPSLPIINSDAPPPPSCPAPFLLSVQSNNNSQKEAVQLCSGRPGSEGAAGGGILPGSILCWRSAGFSPRLSRNMLAPTQQIEGISTLYHSTAVYLCVQTWPLRCCLDLPVTLCAFVQVSGRKPVQYRAKGTVRLQIPAAGVSFCLTACTGLRDTLKW